MWSGRQFRHLGKDVPVDPSNSFVEDDGQEIPVEMPA